VTPVNRNEGAIDIVQTGVQSGRPVLARDGRRVDAALSGNAPAFERRFLDSLNGRG
jgi:purine nucleosidase